MTGQAHRLAAPTAELADHWQGAKLRHKKKSPARNVQKVPRPKQQKLCFDSGISLESTEGEHIEELLRFDAARLG